MRRCVLSPTRHKAWKMTYESSVSHVFFSGQEHQRSRENLERIHQLCCVELLHLSGQSSRTLVIWLGGGCPSTFACQMQTLTEPDCGNHMMSWLLGLNQFQIIGRLVNVKLVRLHFGSLSIQLMPVWSWVEWFGI